MKSTWLIKDVYQHIAIRVANNDLEEALINQIGPIWLTSANLSGAGEIYDRENIEKDFEYYIENDIVEVLAGYPLDPKIPASDIFSFVWESVEVEYLRKN